MSVVTGWHSESGILNQGWGLLYKRIYGLKVFNTMENILRLQFSVQIFTDSNTNNDYHFTCSYRPPLYISMICVLFSSILHYYPWFQRLTFVVKKKCQLMSHVTRSGSTFDIVTVIIKHKLNLNAQPRKIANELIGTFVFEP